MSDVDTPTPLAPAASVRNVLGTLADVVLPLVGRGVIIRRPSVVEVVERLDLDRRAVQRVQKLQRDHGPGPVRLELPGRTFAVVLDPDDARRVLAESPEPFAPATREKRAALAPFQPHGVLASHRHERADRRRFNEAVLDSDSPVHELAGRLQAVMVEETRELADAARRDGRLDWDGFIVAWYRMVRRLVLGDAARDDHAVTDLLADLRASGNWAVARRRHRRTRRRFLRQLQGHLDRAEPGSLAQLVAQVPADEHTAPVEQAPQWLFAYDAAAWTCMRTLALLTNDRERMTRAVDEVTGRDLAEPHDLPFLRACALDTLRLFPTTPAILRETTSETQWASGTLPAGTGVLVFAPFFHRDDRRQAQADRFVPEGWFDDAPGGVRTVDETWPFIPFSAGPAACPGRHLVLLTISTVLGTLLQELALDPTSHRLDTDALPSALSPFSQQFSVTHPDRSRTWP